MCGVQVGKQMVQVGLDGLGGSHRVEHELVGRRAFEGSAEAIHLTAQVVGKYSLTWRWKPG